MTYTLRDVLWTWVQSQQVHYRATQQLGSGEAGYSLHCQYRECSTGQHIIVLVRRIMGD